MIDKNFEKLSYSHCHNYYFSINLSKKLSYRANDDLWYAVSKTKLAIGDLQYGGSRRCAIELNSDNLSKKSYYFFCTFQALLLLYHDISRYFLCFFFGFSAIFLKSSSISSIFIQSVSVFLEAFQYFLEGSSVFCRCF